MARSLPFVTKIIKVQARSLLRTITKPINKIFVDWGFKQTLLSTICAGKIKEKHCCSI